MPNPNDFGALVPVCIGRIVEGGRELVFGEHCPEAASWAPMIQQREIEARNLLFVTREQAAEMAKEATRIRREDALRVLKARLESSAVLVSAAEADMERLEEAYNAAQERLDKALALRREAAAVLDKAATSKAVPELPKAEEPEKPKAEDLIPDPTANAKARAKERLAAQIASLATPAQLGIQASVQSMDDAALHAAAKAVGIDPSNLFRKDLEDRVIDASKLAEVKRRQVADSAAAAKDTEAALADLTPGRGKAAEES